MCGRYAITASPDALRQLLQYFDLPNFPPRYNVAPTQPVPVVRVADGVRRFVLMRWGLIPAWVKDPKTFSLLINARGESVLDKPAFRNAMRYRRCLFPADGFYEWKSDGRSKQPYFIRPADGRSVAFAGLWETWTGPNGEEMDTAAIVTTTANRSLASIHSRMPAVIAPESFAAWLDVNGCSAEEAARLIGPAPDDLFEAYPVSTAVNRTANDSPDLIAPLAAASEAPAPPRRARARAKDDRQTELF